MAAFTTRAIVLRRVAYGDADLIVTLFTLNRGKITVMAKAAKKSQKRFPGALEAFAPIEAVCSSGKGLPILQEASLEHPLSNIRASVDKTAYASFWAETNDIHLEDHHPQPDLFQLLLYVLTGLDEGRLSEIMWSIIFMMRFLIVTGLSPQFDRCVVCRADPVRMERVFFDPTKGGVVCGQCNMSPSGKIHLAKGTLKQLLWLGRKNLNQAIRARFNTDTAMEALPLLETFISYHLGKTPRSLTFLRSIRSEGFLV